LGCAYKKIEKPLIQPESPTISVSSAINLINERNNKIKNISGIANINIISSNSTQRVKEAIVINGDSRIRLESLNITGQPSLIMVSDSNAIAIYNINENRFYRGDASPEVLYKMTGIYLSPLEIADLLAGRQSIENKRTEDMRLTKENSSYILRTQSNGSKSYNEIRFDPNNLSITAIKQYDDGGKVIKFITFSDYKRVGEYTFPFKRQIYLPPKGLLMTVEYTDIEINAEIEESVFNLIIPEDAEEIKLN
jgi:outer membrane lipoprotein-sorting protein